MVTEVQFYCGYTVTETESMKIPDTKIKINFTL